MKFLLGQPVSRHPSGTEASEGKQPADIYPQSAEGWRELKITPGVRDRLVEDDKNEINEQ